MPDQETAFLDQYAVLWARAGTDRYSQPVVSPPVELNVRWEDKQHETLDPHGNVIPADAQVFLDQPVLIGSAMWRGRIADLPGDTLAPPGNVMQVIVFNSTPDLKNRATTRVASLMRWKDALPQVRTS
jgi:hypothetical protein